MKRVDANLSKLGPKRFSLKKSAWPDLRLKYLISVGLLIILSACSLQDIKQQAESISHAARLHGQLETQVQEGELIQVHLFRIQVEHLELVHRQPLRGDQQFYFDVLPGSYMLGAFVDSNEDGVWQESEAGTYIGVEEDTPTSIDIGEDEIVDIGVLTIEGVLANRPKVDVRRSLSKAFDNIGRVVSLDNPMFSRDNASMGFWRPLDYVDEFGGGLMMLQEFDENKIPVIFVHGIFGTSIDFEEVIANLDKDKFQPWVLNYPSGIGLDMISDYFLKALNQLSDQYKFPSVYVVAHSMGGLMTRSFVMNHTNSESDYELSLVVTVNSPLYGMDSAATGVKLSPIVVPAWRDVASNSQYINRVHAWRWPESIPYHLFFSYLPGEEGDGVVPIKSQLSLSLQEEAVRIYGFQAQHAEILRNAEFIMGLNSILEGS